MEITWNNIYKVKEANYTLSDINKRIADINIILDRNISINDPTQLIKFNINAISYIIEEYHDNKIILYKYNHNDLDSFVSTFRDQYVMIISNTKILKYENIWNLLADAPKNAPSEVITFLTFLLNIR